MGRSGRCAAGREPEGRGDHRVRRVLGDGLDHRAGELARVELARVAADEGRREGPGAREIARLEQGRQPERLTPQGAPAEHGPDDQRPGQQAAGGAGTAHEQRAVHRSRSSARPPEELFERRRDPAEARDRMEPRRVAERLVQERAGGERAQKSSPLRAPMPRS